MTPLSIVQNTIQSNAIPTVTFTTVTTEIVCLQALQEQDDLMLSDFDDHVVSEPQRPVIPSLQPKGTAHKPSPSGQAPVPSQLGIKRQQAVVANEGLIQALTFAPVQGAVKHGAPAVDLSVGKLNVRRTGKSTACCLLLSQLTGQLGSTMQNFLV